MLVCADALCEIKTQPCIHTEKTSRTNDAERWKRYSSSNHHAHMQMNEADHSPQVRAGFQLNIRACPLVNSCRLASIAECTINKECSFVHGLVHLF